MPPTVPARGAVWKQVHLGLTKVSLPWKQGYVETQQNLVKLSKLNMYILSHSSKFRRSFCWQLSVICVIKESMTNSFTMCGSFKCSETDYFAMCATVSTFLPADEFIRWYHSEISLQKHMAY